MRDPPIPKIYRHPIPEKRFEDRAVHPGIGQLAQLSGKKTPNDTVASWRYISERPFSATRGLPRLPLATAARSPGAIMTEDTK